MNTLTSRDVRHMLDDIRRIEELTNLLRRAHYDVPYRTVYDAVGGAANIRAKLLDLALTDVQVEAAPMAIAAE
jgi:hypothetical protein